MDIPSPHLFTNTRMLWLPGTKANRLSEIFDVLEVLHVVRQHARETYSWLGCHEINQRLEDLQVFTQLMRWVFFIADKLFLLLNLTNARWTCLRKLIFPRAANVVVVSA